MQLHSPVFENGQTIPAKYTCDGQNINPPLQIDNVPQGANSLVLIMDDPDAPLGSADPGWVHWVVYNIDPSISTIEENSIPKGSGQGMTDFDKKMYGGPCPPSGTHRYYFRLFALTETLAFTPEREVTKAKLMKTINGIVIEQTELVGVYSNNKL